MRGPAPSLPSQIFSPPWGEMSQSDRGGPPNAPTPHPQSRPLNKSGAGSQSPIYSGTRSLPSPHTATTLPPTQTFVYHRPSTTKGDTMPTTALIRSRRRPPTRLPGCRAVPRRHKPLSSSPPRGGRCRKATEGGTPRHRHHHHRRAPSAPSGHLPQRGRKFQSPSQNFLPPLGGDVAKRQRGAARRTDPRSQSPIYSGTRSLPFHDLPKPSKPNHRQPPQTTQNPAKHATPPPFFPPIPPTKNSQPTTHL